MKDCLQDYNTIPVKKKVNQVDVEYSCKKKIIKFTNETSRRRLQEPFDFKSSTSVICQKNKKAGLPGQRNKVERTACSQQSKENFSHVSPSLGQADGVSVFSENCIEFLDVYEDEPILRQKRRRLEASILPWFSFPSSYAAVELESQSSYSQEMINLYSWRLPNAVRPLASGQFDFLVKEYAVTCSKGEERKNTRAAGARGSKKKAESTTSRRRSTRNSKTEEPTSPQNPSSSPPNNSDSDTSVTNSATKTGGAAKKAGKRGVKRRPTKNTEDGKAGKARRETRYSSKKLRSCSSPEVSDEEVEETEQEELKQDSLEENSSISQIVPSGEEQNTNGENSESNKLSDEESSGDETINEDTTETNKIVNSNNEPECVLQKDDIIPSSEAESSEDPDEQKMENELCSLSTDEHQTDLEIQSAEEQLDSVSQNAEYSAACLDTDTQPESPDDEKEMSLCSESPPSPIESDTDSPSARPADDTDMSFHSVEQQYSPIEEETKNLEVETNSEEKMDTKIDSPVSDDQNDTISLDKVHEDTEVACNLEEIEGSTHCESKAFDTINEKIEQELFEDERFSNKNEPTINTISVPEKCLIQEEEDAIIEPFSQDDNEMVPMECDSPNSEHCESQTEKEEPGDSPKTEITPNTNNQEQISDNKLKSPDEIPVAEPKEPEKKEGRQRKSRFHSPSTTWSPDKEGKKERRQSRSRSRGRESPPPRRRSRSRSRERDREGDKDVQRGENFRRDRSRERDRDRERRGRRRSRSRSRSRSRTFSKVSSSDRTEHGGHSPRRRERWQNNNWRNSRGNEWHRRSDQDRHDTFVKDVTETDSGSSSEVSYDRNRTENPDWVKDRIKADNDVRNRDSSSETRWEEPRMDHSGDNWNRNFSSVWRSDRGRGRGRGGFRGGFGHRDQTENRWQARNSFSGMQNNSGNDSYNRFNENRTNRRKGEQEFTAEPPVDRSGWSSASSWAVRRTLPADVQNYYSRRGRNSGGPQSGWMRQEEETPVQEKTFTEPPPSQPNESQPLPPVNVIHPVNVMPQPLNPPPMSAPPPMNAPPPPINVPPPMSCPPPMNAPPPVNAPPPMNAPPPSVNMLPFPMNVPPPPPPPGMNMQPNPFNLTHQLPVHLHSAVPLMQVPPPVTQGLPPPPPPPPPSQQSNTVASQSEGKQTQVVTSAPGNKFSAPVVPNPPKAPANTPGNATQGATNVVLPSSTTQTAGKPLVNKEVAKPDINVDSCNKEKRLQIQELAVHEVKLAIKPYYQNKDITKDEYKEIVRKAVDKVCHSKSGEVNTEKVANLVKAYVDKYKHTRKIKIEEPGKI
ncbi:protein SCAF11 isoform X2 [Erpetoichthys calabaricus]|uniref:protein SCAF11 isoform X2 n=1 Tax=Erpetoichthys calabaricus TaxID=27687 RepID=UPI002234D094|nr:protein SCAF11 isoform X2 [Erpetoichthys calabaricus]